MIKVTKEELALTRPVGNWVLIKPNRGNDEHLMATGQKLFLDISYHKEQHAPVVGTVIAVPEQLKKKFMEWEVDMELMPGDTAFYSYLAAVRALDANETNHTRHNPLLIMCEGEAYFWIDYAEICVAKRHGQSLAPQIEVIIPINGYCLVEPVSEKTEMRLGNLVLEQTQMAHAHSKRYGKVAYVSNALIREYQDGDGIPDQDQVRPGDYVCFERACDQAIEFDFHASMDGKKTFFKIQRRYFNAIIPAELVTDMQ